MAVDNHLFLLGIRHHGPGSAASVLNALTEIQPDVILLEGAPEAEGILPLATHADMRPPIAQLVYAADDPADSVIYPFAEFSPEWQTIRLALEQNIPLSLFDLPQKYSLALARKARQEKQQKDEPSSDEKNNIKDEQPLLKTRDPLDLLAEAAGFSDGERWWEYAVEQRNNDLEVFASIEEAITEVRQQIEAETPASPREKLREAWMRKMIRKTKKDGFERIAVVCGAWHVPALTHKTKVKDDNALLKGLPSIKLNATWVPWTHGRINLYSGYGAGITSPGWYRHLWLHRNQIRQRARKITISWLAKAAALLREENLDVSSASVIEGVRLVETLAVLREQPLPGLDELNESILTTFCFGDETPLRLISEKLLTDEMLGTIPANAPTMPLVQDLERQQKRLRMKPSAVEKILEIDLRKPSGLKRSQLLHRLNLLDIPWGRISNRTNSKGTFKEIWQLQWQPEFAVKLIEAAIHGNTIELAAGQYCRNMFQKNPSLADITHLINTLLVANLPATATFAIHRLEQEAALANDVVQLIATLPPLAKIIRYSDVRNTDTLVITHLVNGLCVRIFSGLGAACSSLDDDAASIMLDSIGAATDALLLLQNPDWLEPWWQTLTRLGEQDGNHGLIAGRCYRLLLNAEIINSQEAARQLQFALSVGVEPAHAAAWLEGLLAGGGTLLLYDDKLWNIVDDWLNQLDANTFLALLPLLRRTFANFEAGARRQLMEKAKQDSSETTMTTLDSEFNMEKAAACLPLVGHILGLKS